MDPIEAFKKERADAIAEMAQDDALKQRSLEWMIHSDRYKYTYNFTWLGRPIIKFPSDIVVMQEIIWDVKPDLIIETGIAHGGSAIFSASMMELLGGDGRVVAVDVDIRAHNRAEIEKHPLKRRIDLLEGDSTSPEILAHIRRLAEGRKTVMVFLDSLHSHAHVLKELDLYAGFVTLGSYLVLPDTFIEHFPKGYFANRPWDVGDNPLTALREFMSRDNRFELDTARANKLLITEAADGYLKRVR